MGKIKQLTIEVENHLLSLYATMGIDKPLNHEDILSFVANDVMETADAEYWNSNDVATGFRRWMESKLEPKESYFNIMSEGFDKDLQREQIEINAGENGKVVLIKTAEGFIIDVYGQTDHHSSITVWEEDLE